MTGARRRSPRWLLPLLAAVVAAAGLLGWCVGRPQPSAPPPTAAPLPSVSASASASAQPVEPVRLVGLLELPSEVTLRQTPDVGARSRGALPAGALVSASAWAGRWLAVGGWQGGSWLQGWTEWPTPIEEPASYRGSVKGTVRFEGKAAPPAVPIARRSTEHCRDQLVADDDLLVKDGKVQNAFVALAPVRGLWRTLDDPLQVVVRDCVLFPHLAGVLPGQQLRVANDDSILHHVAGRSGSVKLFNLALPRGAPPVDRDLPWLGMVRLGSDIHDWETAWVVAAGHPVHAVSDAGGSFEMGGAPEGSSWVVAWHPVLGYAVVPVTVGAGTTEVDIVFPDRGAKPDACCQQLAELEAADPFVAGACAASAGLERRAELLRGAVSPAKLPAACSGG